MAYSKILVFALLVALVAVVSSVSAQTSPTPTTASPTASNPEPPRETTIAPPLPSVTNRPGANYTGPSPDEIERLRSVIDTYATGRANNPGSSPTPNSGKGPGSGADKSIVVGSLAVLATVVLTATNFML